MEYRQGSLSPFQTSSSNHEEQSDNYTEYYVKGGENMENKALDVNTSTTVNTGYVVNSSTEPDPNSEIAMQKGAVAGATYTKPAQVEGEGTYSTTANSRNTEPIAGDTTEPSEIHKAATCCDNACGNCTGPGCGCCADCKADIKKAANCCDNACGNCTGPGCGCCADCKAELEKAATVDCPTCGGNTCPDCKKSMQLCNCYGMQKEVMPTASTGAGSMVTASADEDEDDLEKKEFSTARRKQLAREGKAMGDGSYPIENTNDLKNAIRSWGRGGADPKVKAHIIRRAKTLGASDLIPEDWKKDITKSAWGGFFIPQDDL